MPARSRSATNEACWSSNRRRETASRQPFAFQICKICRRSSRAFAASSILPPIRWRSARISARTLCWRRLSPLARASGSPVHGTGSNSLCAPFSGSRSRWRRRQGSPANWFCAFGEKIVDPAALDQGLTHVFPTPQQLVGADLAAIGMPKARRIALSSLAAGRCRRPADLRPPQKPRRGHRSVAIAGGDRRMDRAVYRHARTARARRLSGGRYRSDASDDVTGTGCGHHPPSCSHMPSNGDPGAPTLRCISGRPSPHAPDY